MGRSRELGQPLKHPSLLASLERGGDVDEILPPPEVTKQGEDRRKESRRAYRAAANLAIQDTLSLESQSQLVSKPSRRLFSSSDPSKHHISLVQAPS